MALTRRDSDQESRPDTNLEPPLPVIDRKILDEENSPCDFVTRDPDLDVLDAQGRPENRAAMIAGAKPSQIVSRKRRKGRTESESSEDLKVEESAWALSRLEDVKPMKWSKFLTNESKKVKQSTRLSGKALVRRPGSPQTA
jgi:hypothetical protein